MRPLPALAALALAAACAAAGCAAPAPGSSADVAVGAVGPVAAGPADLLGDGYDAAGVRALAVTDGELAPGWRVTLMQPGQNDISSPPQTADNPACQPVLDALTPSKGDAGPLAEADLDIAREGDTPASLYTAILAFRPGRAAAVHAGLERVLDRCRDFTSSTGRHRLARLDTPTPEGADAVTAFTLTNETGGTSFAQRALVARTGNVLTVFTTLDPEGRPAPEPDREVVRAQLAKVGRSEGRGAVSSSPRPGVRVG
ncbi:hypothetical protein ACIQBJ_23570 [Kitasatospora sp. NPDC088391]|uniref:hypothetical protein n=1 Tax=Kitasatospora sp. NPDC088391 TaxID=3364074 RepID=UPI00380566D7